jgi:hypothetical protein
VVRKAGRFFNPVTLVLAVLCFTLPFVTVACDTPGGYAGATPGGSSTYNGVALVVGGEPEVTDGHEQPVPAGEDDRLPPQPALAAALLAIVAAAVLTITVGHQRARRAAVAVLAAVGGTAPLVGQVLVEAELRVRVSDHLARLAAEGGQLDPAKTADDYVQTGQGFQLCLALLAVVTVLNGIGWWRVRPRPALVATSGEATVPNDPWPTGNSQYS